jgi:uncharacterized protein with ATP-grasp and redox domains
LSQTSIETPHPIMTSVPGTFPHQTVRVRIPGIIDRVLRHNDYPAGIREDALALRREITDEQPMAGPSPDWRDYAEWQATWAPHAGRTWYEVPWFFAETYFYRRLLDAVHYFEPGPWQGVDPYHAQKREELVGEDGALARFAAALDRLPADVEGRLRDLLLFTLWGNRADLSFETMAQTAYASLEGGQADGLLIDHREQVWARWKAGVEQIDLVADNAGLELLFDLALADFLLDAGLARRVRFHLKSQPFFVSDTMIPDVHDALAHMAGRPALGDMVRRLRYALAGGRFVLTTDPFWVTARTFEEMPARIRDDLRQAELVLFKGDANHRRLLGDRAWPHTASLAAVTAHLPFAFLTIRAIKAPLAVDLTDELARDLGAKDPDWMFGGQYGVIQLAARG